MTRRSRAFAATALVALSSATPLGGRAVGRACAAGNVHIAVVVDSGSGSSVSAVCVPGGSSDNGATILAARASLLGTPQPRFNASGLLCAIDGLPQTGCGEQHNGKYAYWSYFRGTAGTWSYSSFGPGSRRVDGTTVEGWRWQPEGAGLPTDPPPRGPATAGAVCAPQPAPTTARPVTAGSIAPHNGAAAPTPATTPTPGTAPNVIGPKTTGPSPTGRTVGSTADPQTDPPPRTGAATTARGHPSTTAANDASTSSSIALTAGGIAAPPAADSSGGAPVGVIAGALLVAGLGAGGAVAARRRNRAAA